MNPIGFTSGTGQVYNPQTSTPATSNAQAPATTSTPQQPAAPEPAGMAEDQNAVASESGSSQMSLPGVSISISISINGQTMQSQSGAQPGQEPQGQEPQGAQQPGQNPQAGQPGEEPKAGEQGGGGAGSIEELFKKLDGDGDGKISLEELIKGLSGEQGAKPEEGAQPQPSPGGEQPQPGGAAPAGDPQVEELFKQLDTDGDGGLSMEELAKRLQELTQGAPAAV